MGGFNDKTALEAQYNQPVKKELEAIFVSDQFYRRKADSVQNKFGFKSTQMQSLLNSMKTQDKINLQKITAILDKYGWLGPDKVGNRANLALFAVIVHADLPTMEKYFPLLKDAADKNAVSKGNLALLQDKIESAKYHYQTYGTQLGKDEKTNKFSFVPITILMLCLLGISSMSLHITNHNYKDGVMNKVNSIYGEWSEKKSEPDSARAFRMIFFPGGKVNVIRKLNNYIGYFKIHNDKIDYVDGSITIDDKYPFTATFIEPNKIKLVISYRDKAETKYLVKTKEIKSGFQLLDKNL